MQVIALDIGGTSIKVALVDDYKIIVEKKQSTRAAEGIVGISNAIIASIESIRSYVKGDYGIAISSAGDIDAVEGRVIYATDNLPGYSGYEITKWLGDIFKVNVTVINDAMAAIIGEAACGVAVGVNDAIMITLGTGLGGGAICGGKLLMGNSCRAGRFGHITLHDGGRPCTCGRSGCAEQYVSATGLIKTANENGLHCKDSNEVIELAKGGNVVARAVLSSFADDLARVIMLFNDIFDPKVIIIGGGLVEIRRSWWGLVQDKLGVEIAAKLAPAKLGNRAGVLGAYDYYINRNNG